MRPMPKPFFMLAPLLFTAAVQAAPYDPLAHGEGSVVFTREARPRFTNLDPQPGENFGARNQPSRNNRYGIGYDARHGLDTPPQSPRGYSSPMERFDRPQHTAPIERPGRMQQGKRGR